LGDPGVPQRTPEWYSARETMVTASDIAQALGCAKFGTQRTFFQKKCGAPDEQAPFNASLPPLKWGVMYEPVAQAVYSAQNLGVKVHEFGLLRHPTLPFIGASPDGITELGVMLEIKCPWRRKIVDGEIPMQYYYQIQGQLAVCGLEECDYFECELFEASDGPDDEAWSGASADERGVFVETVDSGSYQYPPSVTGGDEAELREWASAHAAAEGKRLHWWVVRRTSTVRVCYDSAFCEDMFTRLRCVWDRALGYREDRAAYLAEVAPPPPPPQKKPVESLFVDDDEGSNS
jgi:putative phage-type endonuclease